MEEVNAELDQAEEALLDALGDDLPARGIRVVVPGSRRNWIAKNKVAKMRQNLEMGQKEFAALLGTSISTLKNGKAGNVPHQEPLLNSWRFWNGIRKPF